MIPTLAKQLESSAVDTKILKKKYKPMLALANELIGVVPNADPILEIWPIGFRTYNLLMPNLLGLPSYLLKKKSLKSLVGLATYISSKTANCSYCTAHSCSFALRRGLDTKVITGERELSQKENAVIEFASSLSSIPVTLTKERYNDFRKHLSAKEIERIVYSIGLMGFLNKFMDATGITIEQNSLQDVGKLLSSDGWQPGKHFEGSFDASEIQSKPIRQDSFMTFLRVLKHAPGAVFLEKKWTRGVPGSYARAKVYLQKHTGYTFPILKNIKNRKILKAITTVIKINLDKETTQLGLRVKYLLSVVYFKTVQNEVLSKDSQIIIMKKIPNVGTDTIKRIERIGTAKIPKNANYCRALLSDLSSSTCLTKEEAAAIILARAMSDSPAEVSEIILKEISPLLTPESIVELGVWISIQQLFHRLDSFYRIAN